MSKNISFRNKQIASGRGQDQIGLVLPTFVLCLRDFILDLVKDDKEMTSDEYLDDCLQIKSGSGNEVDRYNRPRECIRTYFQERKCFTFDRPGDKTVMKSLETAPARALSKSFREDTDAFLDYMYSCETKVLLSSKPVRGKMFATLASAYLDDIRAGGVPDVDDAISVCANIENERIAEATILYFRQELEETTELPILRVDDFNEHFKTLQKKALDLFRAEAVFGADKFEITVTEQIDKIWGEFKEQNDVLVREYCKAELQKAYDESVGRRMRHDKYKVSGGYEEYKKDILQMKKEYSSQTHGFEEYIVQNVLNKFMEDESTNENDILMADKKLSEEDRKKEMERVQKEHEDAQLKQQQLYEQKIEEEARRAAEQIQKMEKEREERRKEEEEQLKAVNEQWKSQNTINEKQIEMMKTENENLKKELKDEISRLVDNNKLEKLKKEKKKLKKELEEKKNRGIVSRIFNW